MKQSLAKRPSFIFHEAFLIPLHKRGVYKVILLMERCFPSFLMSARRILMYSARRVLVYYYLRDGSLFTLRVGCLSLMTNEADAHSLYPVRLIHIPRSLIHIVPPSLFRSGPCIPLHMHICSAALTLLLLSTKACTRGS